MTVEPGQLLAHYRVVAKLGEGGMGEVWRATDTKLDRDVAIKILPAAFTEDAERLARFEREAKVLAQLQHPNIASIYGIEESDGTRALVMELVEGPTLAERLEEGALPIDESLSFARQIAEALEEAHEKGIVHRDLKPQNVKASREGKIKVLDFGLAKAMDPDAGIASGSASQLAASPTLTLGATVQGVILGTAAYMAPEQARGGTVDRRADVWAFGVVLYEMLAGETLFAADTVPDTLARVLTREPDLSKLPDETPPTIRRLVRRCLVGKPKDRLHSIADARIAIEDVLAGRIEEAPREAATPAAAAPAASPPLWRRALPWIGGAVVGAALVALTGTRGPSPSAGPSAGAASIRTLVAAGESVDPAVSPDGRTLAFSSVRNGEERLWIKDLTSGSESLLSKRNAYLPSFSPDGTTVLFTAGENENVGLYRILLATREERLVASDAEQGEWAPDGRRVVFLRGFDAAASQGAVELVVVDLDSGNETVVHRDEARRMNEPRWSPDGRTIALAMRGFQAGDSDRLGLFDVSDGKLVERGLDALGTRRGLGIRGLSWVTPRRLALLLVESRSRGGEGSGRIALLDLDGGEPRSLFPISNVGWGLDFVAPDGLVVGVGSADQNVYEVVRDRSGAWSRAELATEGPFQDRQPTYSPDGRFLLFSSSRSGNLDIWRLDRETGELMRLTDHEADDWDPAYSPDGRSLLFSSQRSGRFEVWMAGADGSSPRQVTDFENCQNPTMTADGAWIVFVRQQAPEGLNGIWRIRPDGSEPEQVVAGTQLVPDTSPDGRYVAFRVAGGQRIARLADGKLVGSGLDQTDRYRWSVEGGKTFLWMIDVDEEAHFVRRHPFDPEQGVLGPAEVVFTGEAVADAESLGVAPDGSAFSFASLANRRGQLLRIDGLAGLAGR